MRPLTCGFAVVAMAIGWVRDAPLWCNSSVSRFRHLSSALTDMAPHGIRMRHRRPNAVGEQLGPGARGVLELWDMDGSDVLLRARARLEYFAHRGFDRCGAHVPCKRHVDNEFECTQMSQAWYPNAVFGLRFDAYCVN